MTSVSNDMSPAVATTDEPVLPNRLRNPAYLRRDATAYLDGVADQLVGVKLRINQILNPRAGQRLVDVGCGTGGDVLALAHGVGPMGRVVGVDLSEELITQARARADGRFGVEFHVGDATELPLPDASFDGGRGERVLQHVADPARAVAELLRVTVPGGRIVLAEPDHDMWVVNVGAMATTRRLLTWWVDHIRNPWMGRDLPGLLTGGVTDLRVDVLPVVLRGLAAADAVIGLARIAPAARAAGVVDAAELDAWEEELRRRDAEGGLLTLGAIVVASGVRAAG